MSQTFKGYLCGCLAAITYGTNPLGALFLYQDGLRPTSVLFYRFAFGAVMLGLLLLAQRKDMRLNRHEAIVLLGLGLLFSASSITYYYSFMFMAAGLSATLLFLYPVMVAAIMALFFGERITVSTVTAIVLSLAGIVLLYKGDGNSTLSLTGLLLVIISALTYAVYIVMLNRSRVRMSSVKLTFYVLLLCVLSNVIASYFSPSGGLQGLHTLRSWLSAIGLGLFPTVLSLVLMAIAVQCVGSTPTAVMGALEPLTAVVIGVLVFHEQLTPRLTLGIVLILTAVGTIIMGKQMARLHMFRYIGHFGHHRVKLWRWR